MFRHGDRSAISPIPSLPTAGWPQGFGQLSKLGMTQQYQTGLFYRKLYGSVVPVYNRSSLWVRSTDVDRTLMSVESQLTAWFPPSAPGMIAVPGAPEDWQPIPIHTVPKMNDGLLRTYDSCPRYTQLKKVQESRAQWAAKLAELPPAAVCDAVFAQAPTPKKCTLEVLIARLAVLAGEENLSLKNIWRVSDTLFCRSNHNKSLPNWAPREVVDYLDRIQGWTMFDMFNGVEERKLTGGPLIKQLIANAAGSLDAAACMGLPPNLRADPLPCDRKLYLYSAHDTTVAALLSALDPVGFDFTTEEAPPYASAIIVELWAHQNNSSPEIRLRYQRLFSTNHASNMTALTVSGCPAADLTGGGCPLATFEASMASVIPADWSTECAIEPAPNACDSENFYSSDPLYILAGISIAVAIMLFWAYFRRQMKSSRAAEYSGMHNLGSTSTALDWGLEDNDEDSA